MKYDVKYSKRYLIGLFCATGLLIAGTIFLTYYCISTEMISSAILQNAKHTGWYYVVFLILLAIVDIVTIFAFISCLKFKLTVEDNKITVYKNSSSKEYDFANLDYVHQSNVSYKWSSILGFTMFFSTPTKYKIVSFNEKMLNWTLLADKLVELGKLKKDNDKYTDHFGY